MDWILFDCDGVLVDSEAIVLQVLVERFGTVLDGVDGVGPEVAKLLGLPLGRIAADIGRRYGVAFDSAWISGAQRNIDEALAELRLAIPDVAWALGRIDLPKAVVSNSRLAHVRGALTRTGLAGHFGDAVFVAEQVPAPKPAPDLYRYAAASLGTRPERCLVVEDSTAGVSAAVAAGMTVIGFTGAGHLPGGHEATQRALGAAVSIPTMRDLPAAVASLMNIGR